LFGWVYGVVVYVWGLLGLDFVDTFAVVPKKEVPPPLLLSFSSFNFRDL